MKHRKHANGHGEYDDRRPGRFRRFIGTSTMLITAATAAIALKRALEQGKSKQDERSDEGGGSDHNLPVAPVVAAPRAPVPPAPAAL